MSTLDHDFVIRVHGVAVTVVVCPLTASGLQVQRVIHGAVGRILFDDDLGLFLANADRFDAGVHVLGYLVELESQAIYAKQYANTKHVTEQEKNTILSVLVKGTGTILVIDMFFPLDIAVRPRASV